MTVARCQATHGEVSRQMFKMQTSVDEIVNTLLGEQKPGTLERGHGLVEEIHAIKAGMKSRWTSKEKATILVSLITAFAAIVVAVFK